MTELPQDAAELRAAFATLAEDAPPPELDSERIWQAVAGELSAEARREIVDSLATDPAAAEAWRLAVELQAGQPVLQAPRRTRPWQRALLPLAALLALALGVGLWQNVGPGEDAPIYRQQGAAGEIRSLLPDGEPLDRRDCRLRWSSAGPEARYDLRVVTPELEVVAEAADLATSEFLVPEEALAGLASGSRLLWQVDARVPGDPLLSSKTFVSVLE